MSEPADPARGATKSARPPRARRRSWGLILGLTIFALLVLVAVFAPVFLTDPATRLTPNAYLPTSSRHVLGTDGLGRDLLARTLVATRLTLLMCLAATAIAVVGGIVIGVGLWLAPRVVRELGLRLVEILITFPGLLLALVVAAIVGRGVVPAVVAIGLAGVPSFARLTANLTAGLVRREFVSTVRLLGVPPGPLAVRHILPNMAEPLLLLVSSSFALSLVELAGLSFIGLGVQPPDYDFGFLLNDALKDIYTSPIQVVGPTVMIVLTALGAMFIGDGLAAVANPRSAGTAARLSRRDPTPGSGRPATTDEDLLIVEDVHVNVAGTGQMLVNGVSFTIRRGEILGIVGESGSGKSLTSAVVAQLLPEGLQAGAARIELNGTDLLAKVSPRQLATGISFVYQDPGTTFAPGLTLGSQLSDVLRVHLGYSRTKARQKIADAFAAVALSDPKSRLRQRPHQLSGGMRQRAMIASATSVDPLLLIADEPTTALDVTVQREILRILRRTNRERKTAVLFISHDLGVVRALCDRVIVMRQGEIVERIDDTTDFVPERVRHPYTKQLLAASPRLRLGDEAAAPARATEPRPAEPSPNGSSFNGEDGGPMRTVCQ